MTYASVYALSADTDFTFRTSACFATETLNAAGHDNPQTWAESHRWEMAATPGFGDAYASALAGSVERPGLDPAVITDGQILAAVQSLRSLEASADAE
jgi:hypothetical protein